MYAGIKTIQQYTLQLLINMGRKKLSIVKTAALAGQDLNFSTVRAFMKIPPLFFSENFSIGLSHIPAWSMCDVIKQNLVRVLQAHRANYISTVPHVFSIFLSRTKCLLLNSCSWIPLCPPCTITIALLSRESRLGETDTRYSTSIRVLLITKAWEQCGVIYTLILF